MEIIRRIFRSGKSESPTPKDRKEDPLKLSPTEMTYSQFLAAQQHLRDNATPSIPFVKVEQRYSASLEMIEKIEEYGLEGNANLALGGVTIFIDSEADFEQLKKFAREQNQIIHLPKIRW